MGRMEDALRKAAEERERKRLGEGAGTPHAGSADEGPAAESAAPARPAGEPNTAARAAGRAAVPARVTVAPDERLVVFNAPSDERAEQFRKVRANLMALRPVPRVLMVTSGAPSEGKSLAAANLALTFLEIEAGEVLLVDANLRYPEVARLLATRPGPGLSEVLTGAEPNASAVIQATGIAGLSVVPAGAAGVAAARMLAPSTLKKFLDETAQRFKFIIVDTPAVIDFADATLMSADVDGVVMVVSVGHGRRESTKKAVEILENSRAKVLGTMVIGAS